MPLNSQTAIQVFSDAVALATYAYAQQDFGVFLREIPSGGTALLLPADPNDGDWYEFEDVDGSCAAGNPIILTAADGTSVLGAATATFALPYSAGVVRYSAKASNWVLYAQAAQGGAITGIQSALSTGSTITTAYSAVTGCSVTLEVTSTKDKFLFWANLTAIGTGSEASGIMSWHVIVDPAGAATVVGFNSTQYAADAAGVNGGAVSGVVTDLSPGTHILRIEAIASAVGLSVGVLGSAQPNGVLTVLSS
jgi:hypothetical protein